MKKFKSISTLLLISIVSSLTAQEEYVKYFHPASKDAALDYRRVTRILTATGQIDDQDVVTAVEAKLEGHRSNSQEMTWSEYLYNLKIPDSLQKEGFELLKNLKHNGAHNLGDILLEQGKYEEAIPYLQAAITHPFYSFGATNMIKDEINIIIKLVKCYENLGQTNELYATALSRLLSNIKLGKGTALEKQLIRVASTNKAAIKKVMDDGLKKVSVLRLNTNHFGEIVEETFFSFMFNDKKVDVLYFGADPVAFMKEVRQTEFYKSLSIP